jgi:pyrimidine deaminase RibD-like protein
MNIHELESYNLGDAVKFHRLLNPRIWGRDEHLLPEVREKLLTIAADFQEFLGVGDLDVEDITISGSNAAYSYTKNSDIDLHIVVKMPDNPVYQELFTAKKYQYNDEHNIRIGGADVELYVQPADQAHHSQGIYSIKDNDWRQIPQRKRAQIDDACVRDKVSDLDARIHAAVKSRNLESISTLWDKIKAMRRSGLEQHGEFGCENIAFKLLRNNGCIQLLKNAMMAQKDRELSLRETPAQPFRYGYGTEVDEASLADMRAAFAVTDAQPAKQEVYRSPYEYEKVKKQREAERQEKIAKIARKPVKPWPGGLEEGHQGQPYSSEDGVAASTKMFCEEDDDDTLVHEFIQHTATELGIDPLPEIVLHTDPAWSTKNHSFGRYDPDTHTLNVSMPNRHILDVLRTVAHELVHCSQNQQHGRLPNDAGETGSEWENDANARAGIIMRDWANTHPEHFEQAPLEEGASGYIPKNKKEAALPQYAMALSVDIKPGEVGRQANKLALHTGRNGEPGLLMKTVNLRESVDDYKIHNTKKLDRVLARCCEMIERGQQKDPERYGQVAACVIDPDNNMVYGINLPGTDGQRRHAERVAIDRYHKTHGDIPEGSIVVTTCSPCNSPMAERAGESCKDLLNSVGIHKVYCGYIDPTQHDDADADFTVGLTQNDDLWEACKAFADTFLHEDDLEESWKKALAGAAIAAGTLGAAHATGAEWTERPDGSIVNSIKQAGAGFWNKHRGADVRIWEAFDQPYKIKWEKSDYGDVDAIAKLDDGNYLSIMFNKGYSQDTKEEAWSVEFFRNNSQEVTGEGDAQRVFATVLGAIQTFIKKYKPNKVYFSASKEVEDGQNSESRAKLYDSLVQRYARTWGFIVVRTDTGDKVTYELSRRVGESL